MAEHEKQDALVGVYRGPTEADLMTILERINHILEELAAVHVLCDQLLAHLAAEGDTSAKNP